MYYFVEKIQSIAACKQFIIIQSETERAENNKIADQKKQPINTIKQEKKVIPPPVVPQIIDENQKVADSIDGMP